MFITRMNTCIILFLLPLFLKSVVSLDPENDEWFIDFNQSYDADGDNNLLDGLTFHYLIAKNKTEDHFQASVMDYDCLEDVVTDAISLGKTIIENTESSFDDALVSVDFNITKLPDSPIWEKTSNTTGDIKCCVQSELMYLSGEDTFSVSFVNTKLTLTVDFLTGFVIDEVAIEGNDTTVESTVTFDVDACLCHAETSFCFSNPTYAIEDKVTICVTPVKGGLEVASFQTLSFYQDGVNVYNPVFGNEPTDELAETEIQPGRTGMVSTKLLEPLDPGKNVVAMGSVILDAEARSRLLKERSHEGAKGDHVTFMIEISLKPPISVSSVAGLWMADEDFEQPKSLTTAGGLVASAVVIGVAVFALKKIFAQKAAGTIVVASDTDSQPLVS